MAMITFASPNCLGIRASHFIPSTTGTTLQSPTPRHKLAIRNKRTRFLTLAAATDATVSKSDEKSVLIINTRQGGHAFIGQHLAASLLNAGHLVYLYDVGEQSTRKPISKYLRIAGDFPQRFGFYFGAETNVDRLQKVVGHIDKFDVIYDNNAKKVDDIRGVCDFGKQKNAKQILFVSSAGTYAYDGNLMPHLEGDEAKGGQIEVEKYLKDQSGLKATSFRPIYIIGPHSAKREYTDYFFHRLMRDQPILIPGSGDELTSLTTVQDVTSMLTLAFDKDIHGEVFNITSPRCVTLDGVARMCARVVGKEPKIIHYNPEKVGSGDFVVKKAFPFRPRHFFADPGKGIEMLGWTPELSKDAKGLEEAIQTCYDEFVERNLERDEVSFVMDKAILAAM